MLYGNCYNEFRHLYLTLQSVLQVLQLPLLMRQTQAFKHPFLMTVASVKCLTSSFFSLSMSASFWLLMYSVSIRANCRRSSSSAARRPLYSASSKQASSTVFESLSAASLSRVEPKCVVNLRALI